MKKRNLQLPDPVDRLLDAEANRGTTITSTLSAAVYWYFNRLEAQQRELARTECSEWLDSGKVPPSGFATQMEEALRTAQAQGSRRGRRKSEGV